jgi:outer membrane protein assembly factor BamB
MTQPLEPGDPLAAGEFRLRARLGAGGMGQVYLGYSPAGRAVAVKICHPELAANPAFVARFAREVAAARAVSGLYTAPVIAAGPNDNPPWLATSYVPGPALQHAVTRHGPLPEAAVWRLAAGLAEALMAVHARGLIHRDLKPSNVLLAADGPRVIDFGIARALDGTQLTTTGFTLGTPGYMAPEQATGQSATPASDVFALGSVLCFAATGNAPFGDGAPSVVLYRVVNDQPALEAVPRPLRALINDLLAKDPASRPTLAQVLRTCQAHAPQLSDPSAMFWPAQVAGLIVRYQAGLDDPATPPGLPVDPPELAGEPPGSGGGKTPEPADGPSGERTQTVMADGVIADRPAPADPAAPGAAGAQGTGLAQGNGTGRAGGLVSRRGALVGLAAAGVAAGLGLGGWAYARSRSGSGHPAGATSSQLLWARETGGPVSSGAALANGVLYVGSDDGNVHAFEAASGRPVTTFHTAGAVAGGVVVAGGTLFAGGADHTVYAFRVGVGGSAWTYRTGGPVNCTPTVANGTVYIGSDDGYFYAIHAGTGRLAWRHRTGGPVRSTSQLGTGSDSDEVFVGSDDQHVYALGTDGKLQWRVATSAPVTAGVIYESGVIYASDTKGNLYGLYSLGGSVAFRTSVRGAVRGTPAFLGEFLYLGSADSAVHQLNSLGGHQNWSYPTSGPVNSGPSVSADGTTVYAGDDDGYVYAIDIASITARWSYRVGGAVRSRLLAADGRVYVGSDDHHVYALRA